MRTILAACTVALLCAPALARQDAEKLKKERAQQVKDKAVERQPAAKQAEDPMMKAWMDASTPNENHKRLDPFVGAWEVEVGNQFDPSKPAEKSQGQTITHWVLDGRYLLQEHTGTMMGFPFKGLGLWGYDNVAKQYVGIWSDTMTTGYMTSTGQYDEKTKSWTMVGSYTDPMGKVVRTREVITLVSNDKNTFDFYQSGPDGKEYKAMSAVYTRKEMPRFEVTPIEIKPTPVPRGAEQPKK
jgi:hypothetical protein